MAEAPRALVVEDDRSWQSIVTELLRDSGLEVDVADNVGSAVACAREVRHRLAVVDLSLGGDDHNNQDGLRVLDAVRLHDPGCVTVLLSGFATVELAVSALTEHGALTCLRKAAFKRAEFRQLVNRALAAPPPILAPPANLSPAGDNDSQQVGNVPTGGQRDAPASPDGGPSGLPDRGPSGCVALVVEDDAGWRGILSELLVEVECRVRVCAGFGEALGYLRREKYVVAVIDLSLSHAPRPQADPDGYRLLAATRTLGVPTIVVSGTASPEAIQRAYLEYGVFACLEKRAFDRAVFRTTVDEARASNRAASGDLDTLTDRERGVLELLARGLTNKEIGNRRVITNNTVKRHLKSIFEKLEVHTRAAAVARAVNAGLAGTESTKR